MKMMSGEPYPDLRPYGGRSAAGEEAKRPERSPRKEMTVVHGI